MVLPQSDSPDVVALGSATNTLPASCNLICAAAAAQIEPNKNQSQAAKRNVDGLPELPLAKWEVHQGIWGWETVKGSLTGPANAGAAWGAAQPSSRVEQRSAEPRPGLALPFGSDASSGRGHSLSDF